MSTLIQAGKIILIALAIGLTGAIDYAAAFDRIASDIVSWEFYLFPILLGAVWFGKRGGLLISLCAVYVYLPSVVFGNQGETTSETGYLLEAVALMSFGLFAAFIKDVRKLRLTLTAWPLFQRRRSGAVQQLLLCLDEPQDAVASARSLLGYLEPDSKVAITIMGILRDPKRESFAGFDEFYRAVQEEYTIIEGGISEAMEVLVKGGMDRKRLLTRVVRIQTRSSDREILTGHQFRHYETVMLGSRKLRGSLILQKDRDGKSRRLPAVFLPAWRNP
jgi:hypothetical protein